MKKTVLTGIKPTGTPHLGNYLGAIKTALESVEGNQAIFFIADYHALNMMYDPNELKECTYAVAATWLALGLDTEKALFYKQSDIAEIFELNWILSCFTPKGYMNRAHGYKDKTAKNIEAGIDEDSGVNMGLYTYPCLMNADILLFSADEVPVGKDQKQHLEFARDIATRFNKNYNQEILVIPEPIIREETDVIPGLDGRKMSKSYDNTIELFLDAKPLRKKVNKIVTNSLEVEDVKDPDTCQVFKLYSFFASKEEQDALAAKYRAGGMGWGEAKQTLYLKLEEVFSEARDKYNYLMANRDEIDVILAKGAAKARVLAKAKLDEIKLAIGVK